MSWAEWVILLAGVVGLLAGLGCVAWFLFEVHRSLDEGDL